MPKAIHHFDSASQPPTPNCSLIRFRIKPLKSPQSQKAKPIPMPKAIHHFDSESQPQIPNCSPIRFRIETSDVNCRRFWGERRFPIERGGQSHDFRARKTRRLQPLPRPFSFFWKERVKSTRTQRLAFRKRTSKHLWNEGKMLKKQGVPHKKNKDFHNNKEKKVKARRLITSILNQSADSELFTNTIPNQTPEVNWRQFWIGMWPESKNRGRKPNQNRFRIATVSPWNRHRNLISGLVGSSLKTQDMILNRWGSGMAIQNQNGKLFPPYHIHDSESQPQNQWAEHWLTWVIWVERRFRIETWQEPLPQSQEARPIPCLRRFITSILNHNPRLRIVHWADSQSNPASHLRDRNKASSNVQGDSSFRFWITTPDSEVFIDPIPNQTPEITSVPESKASSNA